MVNDLVLWLTVWLNFENVLLTFKWYVFMWQKCSMLYANCHFTNKQATGLDAWAWSVKCPARFVSHLHYIYIWVVYSFCLLFVHCCNVMVCVVYCVGKWQGWGQFNSAIGIEAQFQFWNWNWNWWNWKWNWNWRLWNWNWKPELIFLQLLPQHLLVNQQFPNFSFNRGHNFPCDQGLRRYIAWLGHIKLSPKADVHSKRTPVNS